MTVMVHDGLESAPRFCHKVLPGQPLVQSCSQVKGVQLILVCGQYRELVDQ